MNSYNIVVGVFAVSLVALGCDKDKGEDEETTATIQGVVTDEQPDGSDAGGGDDGIPDCVAGECPKTDTTTRSQCLAKGDFWYDENDVDQNDVEGFEGLKPSCHNDSLTGCPKDGLIHWARSDGSGGTVISSDVDDYYVYASYDDVTDVYSTVRCFNADGGVVLGLSGNLLKTLDLTVNPNIVDLDVGWNEDLGSINFPADVSLLDDLNISYTKVDPADLPDLSALTRLNVGGLLITSLDLSGTPNLQSLRVATTGLTSLDLAQTPDLNDLDVSDTQIDIPSLDLEDTGVTSLAAGFMGLTDLSGIPDTLVDLDVSGNNFGALDVSAMTTLMGLSCFDCNLTSITFGPVNDLRSVSLWYNQLVSVDLSNLTQLEWLDLSNNLLTAVDLSASTALYGVDLSDNDLTYDGTATKLDLSALSQLRYVTLRGNDNFTLRFESGITFHADYLADEYAGIRIESAKWDACLDLDKPAWFVHGSDPDYTYYDAFEE